MLYAEPRQNLPHLQAASLGNPYQGQKVYVMEDSILACTILLGGEDETWFHHQRDPECWTLYLWIRRN